MVRTPGAQPATIHPTRSFAMLHLAIRGAVDSIDRTPRLIRASSQEASQEAAAAAAAHDLLVALYPSFAAQLDTQLQQSLAQVPDGAAKTEGVRIGQDFAGRVSPRVPTTAPRRRRSSLPSERSPAHISRLRRTSLPAAVHELAAREASPWSARASSARPASRAGERRLRRRPQRDQVPRHRKRLHASADQALTGRFWNGAIQNYWNEIAQTAALNRRLTTAETARLFALLDVAIADSVIAFYDAKYTYAFWRR